MRHATMSTAIRVRLCMNCRKPIQPGTDHVKVYKSNICKACFVAIAFKILGTKPFKDEFVGENLAYILAEEV